MSTRQLPVNEDDPCAKGSKSAQQILTAPDRCTGVKQVKKAGWARNLCVSATILAALYIVGGIVLLIFCTRGRVFGLIDDEVDDNGMATPTVLFDWNPTLSLGIGFVLIGFVYLVPYLLGAENYYAKRIYDRAEFWVTLLGYAIHAFILGSASALFSFNRYWYVFLLLVCLFSVFVFLGYIFTQQGTGGRRTGYTLTALAGLWGMATIGNVIFWLTVSIRAARKGSAVKPWELYVVILFTIVSSFVVWANYVAWFFSIASYGVIGKRRGNFYNFIMIQIWTLGVISLLIILPTWLSAELNLF